LTDVVTISTVFAHSAGTAQVKAAIRHTTTASLKVHNSSPLYGECGWWSRAKIIGGRRFERVCVRVPYEGVTGKHRPMCHAKSMLDKLSCLVAWINAVAVLQAAGK